MSVWAGSQQIFLRFLCFAVDLKQLLKFCCPSFAMDQEGKAAALPDLVLLSKTADGGANEF